MKTFHALACGVALLFAQAASAQQGAPRGAAGAPCPGDAEACPVQEMFPDSVFEGDENRRMPAPGQRAFPDSVFDDEGNRRIPAPGERAFPDSVFDREDSDARPDMRPDRSRPELRLERGEASSQTR